jgi:hypothetical protein
MDLELNSEGGSGGPTSVCGDQLIDACGAEPVLDLPHGGVPSLPSGDLVNRAAQGGTVKASRVHREGTSICAGSAPTTSGVPARRRAKTAGAPFHAGRARRSSAGPVMPRPPLRSAAPHSTSPRCQRANTTGSLIVTTSRHRSQDRRHQPRYRPVRSVARRYTAGRDR